MKKKILMGALLLLSASTLIACSFGSSATSNNVTSSASKATSVSQEEVSISSISVSKTGDTSNLNIVTEDGTYTTSNSTLTITSAGTYTLSGELNGMIYVDAGDEDEVEIDLNNVNLVNAENSPIFIANAGEVKIKALKGSTNTIEDQRSTKTSDDATQGEGAIYSTCDLKLIGSGTLNVIGSYNNGIHGNDDVTIKNQTLTVTAPHHAVKANDSITIEEGGKFTFIGQGGDGLHTDSSDISSSSNQRGNIVISGGDVTIYSATDGIDASYDAKLINGQDSDGNTTTPTLKIYTNQKWSSYDGSIFELAEELSSTGTISYFGPSGDTRNGPGGNSQPGGQTSSSSNSSSVSAKGIKAANSISIEAGEVYIASYDDGLHANYGDTLENGSAGVGDITISGGSITIEASDDGVHADRYLNLQGGYLYVSAYEGIEGNQILVSGGEAYIYGSDDGVNATSGSVTTKYEQTGGYLFTAVSPSGDNDGLDSNGSIYIKGGVCIAAGPASQNMAAIDADGSISVSGGTLMYFGGIGINPSASSGITKSSKAGTYSAGTYNVTIGSTLIKTGTLNYSYSGCVAYSSLGSISSVSKA